MSHGTHLNKSWHTYESTRALRRAPCCLCTQKKHQMCVYLCLCLCPCLSLSLRLCLCRFLCVDVSVCKYNPIYKYAHSCIRVHTHHDRSTKKGQKKGAMSHYDTWYTLPNSRPQHTATNCNTLQHTATHCNTLQHTATHCNTLQHTATHCNTLQPMAW